MLQKKTKSPLNGRGTAMVTAAPVVFGVCEAIFHANPIVGGALALLSGAIAYRHFDDVEAVVEQIAEGALTDYVPKAQMRRANVPTKKNGGTQEDAAKIIIGPDKTGKERGRPLEKMKNTLILGLPGQGKSSLACWLISQMVEQGARLLIIDRHARSDESLAAMLSPFERAFLVPPAYTYDDIEMAVELAENLLDQRMEGRLGVDFPVILAIDEFTDLMKKSTRNDGIGKMMQRMADVVESYNAMGRKYGCYSLCIGQLTNASRTGGTEIRSLFATKLLLGMEDDQARMVVSKEVAARVARLNVGECMVSWEGREEPFKVTFPKKSQAYYQKVAKAITSKQLPGSASVFPGSFQAQNQENTLEVEAEVPLEVQYSPHAFSLASNALPLDNATSMLREIGKRVRSGEALASIRKDYGLPESGRALQETNDALRWLGENCEEE